MLTYITTSGLVARMDARLGVSIETCISALTEGHCWGHGAQEAMHA